jgi:hypothetical protein
MQRPRCAHTTSDIYHEQISAHTTPTFTALAAELRRVSLEASDARSASFDVPSPSRVTSVPTRVAQVGTLHADLSRLEDVIEREFAGIRLDARVEPIAPSFAPPSEAAAVGMLPAAQRSNALREDTHCFRACFCFQVWCTLP